MEKRINFSELELRELLEVIRLCSPEVGISRAHMAWVIITYFKKHGKTEMGFFESSSGRLVKLEECKIEIGDFSINAEEVLRELLSRELIYENRVQAEDKDGNKLWEDEERRIPRTIRFLKLR